MVASDITLDAMRYDFLRRTAVEETALMDGAVKAMQEKAKEFDVENQITAPTAEQFDQCIDAGMLYLELNLEKQAPEFMQSDAFDHAAKKVKEKTDQVVPRFTAQEQAPVDTSQIVEHVAVLNDSDRLRLEWCVEMLRSIVKALGQSQLSPDIIMVIAAIKRVLQPSIYEPSVSKCEMCGGSGEPNTACCPKCKRVE